MSFINKLEETSDKIYNVLETENGALGYATTHKYLLDMNFRVASYRHCDEITIIQDFVSALNQTFDLAVAWLFYVRDVRQGLGERRLFRILFKYLAQGYPDIAKKLINKIAEYARWDDLFCLLDTEVKDDVLMLIATTLKLDILSMKANKSISLLAKWMPSINTSSKDTRAKAKLICKNLKLSEKDYRKLLSSLRSYLKIVEKDMSAKDWDKINYEAVPSKANLLYKNAFLKHDELRRKEYLDKLSKGEVKINSSTAFPHDIVHKYIGDKYSIYNCEVDATLEAMWKALPNFGLENTLVVADGSGSMCSYISGNSRVSALEIANALAIYCAERNSGEFKDKYITFSGKPQLVSLTGKTLLSKLQEARNHNEVANTNIEATFDLILNTAIENNMKQEDFPKNILIISDMEFDSATSELPNEKLFTTIRKKYETAGYKVPRLVFWNVNSRTGTIPVTQNELGVALVSGFSQNILKMVMSGELDPWKLLVELLTSKRYEPILEAIK